MAKTRIFTDISKEQKLDFIALLETGKKESTQAELNGMCGGRNFIWHWTESHGRSGGILLGVNFDVIEVGSIVDGDLFYQVQVKE